MPYKFIGRSTYYSGKTLWEIVGNLKDFGVGRIIARGRFERYPERSWLKILEVQPVAAPKDVPLYAYDKPRFVSVRCEKYWRGKKLSDVFMNGSTYKADFKLIPKSEEAEYCKVIETSEKRDPRPATADFPPLFRELLKREKGTLSHLTLQYKRTEYNRMVDPSGHEVSKPDKSNAQFGKPVATRFYESVLE
ncbi:uncharacterized protein LOC132196413 [Neocloeon triangulifer]|uniref:uncharacterized protein LOC132196413 n=1 Tax=Neocloeon triangulifer TaxID=2078957 RepID=UPI00286F116B|nr:uncharacterized protein LOC132196413 [Neocloeon triangulifer]